jgi:signal transduction histidine kinase
MFSNKSLFKRTFLLIVLIFIAIALLFSSSLITNQHRSLLEVFNSQANIIAKSVALVSSDAMIIDDESFIVEHIQNVLKDNDEIKYILVTKREGESIYNDAAHWRLLDGLPQVVAALDGDKAESKILQSELCAEKVHHYSYPVLFSGIKWGWISIGLSLEQYNKNMQSMYQNSFLLIFAMLIASVLFSYILAKWLVQPISMLNSAARKIAGGDLSVKVDISQKGEIGELALSFNHMTDALKKSDLQLRNSNDVLEQRVAQRTEELYHLNQQLDQRVKEEVLKRAEQEQILIGQSRFAAMGEMIGNIAHQWRQPLNALSLLMQNIEYAYENGSLNEQYINRVVEKGNKLTQSMSQTIDDFRNFFKPNKDFEVFSYAKAYESTMTMVGSSIANNIIKVTEYIDNSVCVNGFSSEFSQVILNILNNAKDALVENKAQDREIVVRIYKENEYAYFMIEDNAGGIQNEILGKIFDPYFTTKEEGKGTGIGLYMSKTIIENNMHGTLKVENSTFGARFTMKIKLHPCAVNATTL